MTRNVIFDLQTYINDRANDAIDKIKDINGRLDQMEQDIYNLKIVDVMHDKELDKMRHKGYHLRIKKGGNEVVVKLG